MIVFTRLCSLVAIGILIIPTFIGGTIAIGQTPQTSAQDRWQFSLRSRVPTNPNRERFHTVLTPESWQPAKTAIIVCDLWDNHHSPNAVDRVNELVPRIEAFLTAARNSGAVIIHAPSDCMSAYPEHPARHRALAVPQATIFPPGIERWCTQIPPEELGTYPIDQADGGEDDDPERHAAWAAQNQKAGRNPRQPWLQQHPDVSIDAKLDYISDQGTEVWSILESRGIENVALVGVHVNMCVLGRPFGLRNLVTAGKRAVLVRDLTDSMYNPARWPYVNHHTGTDLIVQHIEKYVCPTITSDQLLGGQPFRFASDKRTRLAILIAEPEYDTDKTLPEFAAEHLGKDFQVEFIFGSETDPADLPSLHLLSSADAALLSIRRRALRSPQMSMIREFVKSGKPMIGVRTASHPFHGGNPPSEVDLEEWPEFDAEVWGGNYTGHFGNDLHPQVRSLDEQVHHSVLGGETLEFMSTGSLYQNSSLQPGTTPLLAGQIEGKEPQPVAWTYVRSNGARSFYTSLGHAGDFRQYAFRRILRNGIYWATAQEPSPSLAEPQGFWQVKPPATMPSTRPWQLNGDAAEQMVAGIDRFLLRKLNEARSVRFEHWNKIPSVDKAWEANVQIERQRLARQLGVQVPMPGSENAVDLRFVASPEVDSLLGKGENYEIHRVTWRAFGDVWSHGLLVKPVNRIPLANILAIPDCEVWPQQLIGLSPGVPPVAQYARRMAESGCQVLIPLLVNRREQINGITHREWLYRPAFEMGRGIIGYEVQELIAAVGWFRRSAPDGSIGCFGFGEGGLLSLYLGALDERVGTIAVSGYFGSRELVWNEPLDRNVFGRLQYFGDAELASMIAPRTLVVEAVDGPTGEWQGGGGAPAKLSWQPVAEVQTEWARMQQLVGDKISSSSRLVIPEDTKHAGTVEALRSFLEPLGVESERLIASGPQPNWTVAERLPEQEHAEKIRELDRHTQQLLHSSRQHRDEHFWSRLDFSSLDRYETSTKPLRVEFYDQVIGRFSDTALEPRAQSRFFSESEKWVAYEVALDVYPDVFAYGILLLPKDLRVGERRPVVVCQHGLEGRPQDTVGQPGYEFYKAFAAQLANEGYITFAPQNPYIFGDRFRTLQRKANPLGKTLFSIITPQHQQILNWLRTQSFVDEDRIAFYGLSYGGKTAMRVPAIVTDYCLSICSADFNEWVDKNASTTNPRSYVNTGEYEIFEFDLGHTFNYAEMSALIAPRPFMVERGHRDGVADDWTVAWEYARVRHLFAARLKIPERTEIEWFDGPHTINGQRSFEFLRKHLSSD